MGFSYIDVITEPLGLGETTNGEDIKRRDDRFEQSFGRDRDLKRWRWMVRQRCQEAEKRLPEW